MHISEGGHIVKGVYLSMPKKLLWIARDDAVDSLKICNLDIHDGGAEMGASMTLLSTHSCRYSIVEDNSDTGCWVLGVGSSQLWRYAGDVGAVVETAVPGRIAFGSFSGDGKLSVTHDRGKSNLTIKRTLTGVYEVSEHNDKVEEDHLQPSEMELFAAGLLNGELPPALFIETERNTDADGRDNWGKARERDEGPNLTGEKGAVAWLKELDPLSLSAQYRSSGTHPAPRDGAGLINGF